MNFGWEQVPFARVSHFQGETVHLGISGSVAAYKAAELLRALLRNQIHVSATVSPGARNFVSPLLFASLGAFPVYEELFQNREEIFAHLEPGQRAKAMLIAPASANAIACIAQGLASDMLSAQALAFAGPLLIAPAMNPKMWNNPATQDNIRILNERGAKIIYPDNGYMADGESGTGKLAELPEIYLALLKALSPQDMQGKRVLVTLGPTREYWDGVRFWSNPSTGKMGAAIAVCAWLRGAEVVAVSGPISDLYLPSAITLIPVVSAQEMFAQASSYWPASDIGIFCAAVADFAPMPPSVGRSQKFKKNSVSDGFEIAFQANPDILQTLSLGRKPGQKILGFAAEIAADAEKLLPLAKYKLDAKKADLLAANLVNPENSAFGAEDAAMAVLDRNGNSELWPKKSKADIAWDLCSWLLRI